MSADASTNILPDVQSSGSGGDLQSSEVKMWNESRTCILNSLIPQLHDLPLTLKVYPHSFT